MWSVHFVARDLPSVSVWPAYLGEGPEAMESWWDRAGVPDGLPFLLSPRFEYDVALNAYFLQANVMTAPQNTNANRARAIARFLNFLLVARGGRYRRSATVEDHWAFHHWRRRDPAGPRVSGGTWNQEVSLVNSFYEWAVGQGHAAVLPIPQREARPAPAGRRDRKAPHGPCSGPRVRAQQHHLPAPFPRHRPAQSPTPLGLNRRPPALSAAATTGSLPATPS